MLLGTALILAALSLFLRNQWEDHAAGEAVKRILPQVKEQLEAKENADAPAKGPDDPNPYDPTMTGVEIDGYIYVGYLSIPALELELPVMSEWDYTRLKTAPCRYSGSTKTGNLVICAHNYARHFGSLKNLSLGDQVFFTDMDGMTWQYEAAAVEILPPSDMENMTSGEYDLTLFTCTYSGQGRVTVRCGRLQKE